MKTSILYILLLTGSINLTFCQASFVIKSPPTDSLMNKLLSGNDDISIILDLYNNNKNLTEDSLLKLLDFSNQYYLNNDKTRKSDPDLQFRYIYFSDQYYRVKCYSHKLIKYDIVKRNDSVLQTLFLQKTNEYKNLDLLNYPIYQMTFSLLLTHSVSTLQTDFFVNNFYEYSSAFSNNFIDNKDLKGFIDIYLKFKYNKQYFGTEYGKGKLPDGTFGLLPKIADNEFKEILNNLKIKDAVY
jgi:hypothetical protein